MISAFKRLNVVLPSSSSSSSDSKPLIPPKPQQQQKSSLRPRPIKNNNNNKRTRPLPQPVKFTYSKQDIERSEQLSVAIDTLSHARPLKKQRITPSIIYETDIHEQLKDKPNVPNCILELFTFLSAEYNNEIRSNLYKDCTLLRNLHGIGKPGDYLPFVCVEPAKARITFVTPDNKQWKAQIGYKVFNCVLVGQ